MIKKEFFKDIKFFKENEFDCKCGCGFNIIKSDLVYKLDMARELSGISFVVFSGCRCKLHNSLVNGSETSSHLEGYACDIRVRNSSERWKILRALISVGFKRIGVYKDFIHVDIDPAKVAEVIWYK